MNSLLCFGICINETNNFALQILSYQDVITLLVLLAWAFAAVSPLYIIPTILSASIAVALSFREIPAVSHLRWPSPHSSHYPLPTLKPADYDTIYSRAVWYVKHCNCSINMWLIACLRFRRNRWEWQMVFWDNGCFLLVDCDLRLSHLFRLHGLIQPVFVSFVSLHCICGGWCDQNHHISNNFTVAMSWCPDIDVFDRNSAQKCVIYCTTILFI